MRPTEEFCSRKDFSLGCSVFNQLGDKLVGGTMNDLIYDHDKLDQRLVKSYSSAPGTVPCSWKISLRPFIEPVYR